MSEQTTATELPITEILIEEMRDLNDTSKICTKDTVMKLDVINKLLPQVRALEEELVTSLKKEKEETLASVFGILEEMICYTKNRDTGKDSLQFFGKNMQQGILQEAIERIREGLSK